MKNIAKLKVRWKGIIDMVKRFPLVIILLISSVITNAIAINLQKQEPYIKLLVTFLLGAFIYAVFQLFYERFCLNTNLRYLFMGLTIILSATYYFLIKDVTWSIEITIRTIVIIFILMVAFLWVPVIRSRVTFNESFLASFKAFFVALFFNGILFLGVALIISVTNVLIFNINAKAYLHTANIIFLLFAPTHYLSLIPYYPKQEELRNLDVQEKDMGNQDELIKREEDLIRYTTPVKFLETLISFVIIPITVVFTIILLLYIILNITKDFWKDNLMEPLLVSYSIIVIIVYLLASTMKNNFTKYFRMIFPKVLIPVVLFQTISSLLKIGEVGVTYGRYYVVMFGVFATAAGIIFSIKPVQKNGLIAPLLIVLSVISIFPYLDAFSLSRVTQVNRLVNVLEKNDMLIGETIIPNSTVSEKDKKVIVSSINYLNQMGYSKKIEWLKNYSSNYNFETTFGFAEYEQAVSKNNYITILRDQTSPINITGYDYMTHTNIYNSSGDIILGTFDHAGKTYVLRLKTTTEQVIILEKDGTELIHLPMKEIYDKFISSSEQSIVKTDEVTFTEDNSSVTLTIVAESININIWEGGNEKQADIYILLKLK